MGKALVVFALQWKTLAMDLFEISDTHRSVNLGKVERGVTQPVVSDYEHGELRVHGELIIELAEILRTSANEILGLEKNGKTETAVKNRRLHRRLQAIDKLPRRVQEALLRTIDAFLSKAS